MLQAQKKINVGLSTDSLENLYIRDVKKCKLLDRSEERLLLGRIHNGDLAAREKFLKSNLKLVLKVANRFFSYNISHLDLIQEGNLALIYAVDSFDLNSQGSFSTFAVLLIRQRIWKFILERSDNIYVPRTTASLIYKINKSIWQIRQLYGRNATNQEIAEITGIDVQTVNQVRYITLKTIPLDMTIGENQKYSLEEIVPDRVNQSPEDMIEGNCIKDSIYHALMKLKPRERQVLEMRFGLNNTVPQTLKVIAEHLNVSIERVRQIENSSLEKLRRSSCIYNLYEFHQK